MQVAVWQQRRERWFRLGVHAIGCVLSPAPPEGAYLCPLCLDFFTMDQLRAGVLTDEHVPAKAVGGKALVLTCRACNGASSVCGRRWRGCRHPLRDPCPDRFVRDITVLVRNDDDTRRRDDERHENVLVATARIPALLAAHGLTATVTDSFDPTAPTTLPPGLRVITAPPPRNRVTVGL